MSRILKVMGLEVTYGVVRAVKGVDLYINEKQIVAILGANGAGKSSIIKAIIGLIKPSGGKMEFLQATEIQGLPAHKINQMGIAWVPEGRQVFCTLSVYENLLMGAFGTSKGEGIEKRLERVTALFPILEERKDQLGGSLSGGEQQMLTIGRALMSNPKLLLMDEPSLGLAPLIVQKLFELIKEIRGRGVSILMAEQNARQALKVADHVYLMEVGNMRGNSSPKEMGAREDIRRIYLGS